MSLRRLASWFASWSCVSIGILGSTISPGFAVNQVPLSEQLEVLRTDPATVRTPQGQWQLTRDDSRWDDFRNNYGVEWRARWNEVSRTPHRAFGGTIPPERLAAGVRPSGPRDKESILRLAESFVHAAGDLLGARWEDVRPAVVEFRGGRWIVILQQESQGVEVVGGRIDLRFSAAGELMLFGSDIFPTPAAKALPTLGRDRILASARVGLPDLADGTPAPLIGEPELVLLPLLAGEPRDIGARKAAPRDQVGPSDLRVRPAYRLRVKTDNPPGDWVTFVDAATGQILERTNHVRFINVTGTVTGEIHPLTGNDTPVTVEFFNEQVFGGDVTGTVVSYNFESGAQGWTADVPWGLSNESVNGGVQAWSDSPGDDYDDNANASLRSPAINISGVTDPVLVFSTALSLEDTWDFLYVEASADNGVNWTTLRVLTGFAGWHPQVLDLAAVEGTSTLRVRFRLQTDAFVVDDGAWIDDVSIARRGSAVTDAGGEYSLDTTGAGTTISTALSGPFGRVVNLQGANATASGTPSGGVRDLHWNDANSHAGERDCFYGMSIAYARIKEIDPGFTGLDYQLPVFARLPNYCNAYWAGQQIVMGAGTGATCADLSTWIPVMYHEYGHGITEHTYAPFTDPISEMHEAFSDYFASTITNDPRVGTDLTGPGSMFRTIENNLRHPEDRAGQGHIDGTILAGSLWDMRNLLDNVALADSLFHFARYGRPYNYEDYFIELLLVDDDDANLGNGTPNQLPIRSAFGYHGIGIGPEFEHVYVEVQDGAGNGDGRLDPGEQADLELTFHNFGGAETGVWVKISTSVPDVTISADSVFIGNVGAAASTVAPGTFQVQIGPSVAVGTAIVFDLHIQSDLGYNGDTFMLPVGYVPILLVDDDRTRTYETLYKDSLDRLGYKYTRWVAAVLGSPSAEEMAEYCSVIWLTGNDNTVTLSASDQTELAAYLGAGGRLFITGEDIGNDLHLIGTASDLTFYQTWLHALVDVESEGGISPPSVNGVGGDVVGNGVSFTLNGGTSANNQSSVSSLQLQAGAVAAFRYAGNNRVAGLRFSGSHRLVYLAFGFEGITTAASRDTVMSRALGWLCPAEAQAPSVTVVDPNGGQSLTIGATYEIQWTATDDVAVLSVDILLSTDNGQTYSPIATGVPNNFAFDWTVDPTPSDSCLIRVTAVDPSSNVGEDVSNTVFAITPPTDVLAGGVPQRYALHAAVPNPFNPNTRLRFDLPRTSRVWLDVVGVDGRHVRSIVAGQHLPAGRVERTWDGRDDRGNGVAAGVYLVHMRAGEFAATRKVQLVK